MSGMTRGRRRQITKEWEKHFDEWRRVSAKYGDALNKIETVEMWEGTDDKPADAIVAVNILEHRMQVDEDLFTIKGLAKKIAVFSIELDALRDADAWRSLIGTFFHIVIFD